MIFAILVAAGVWLGKLLGVSVLVRLLLAVVLLAYTGLKILSSTVAADPFRSFCYSWLCAVSFYNTEIFTFGQEFSNVQAELFAAAACVAVTVGYTWGTDLQRRKDRAIRLDRHLDVPRTFVTVCAVLGLLGAFLFGVEMIVVAGVNFSSQADIRQTFATREVTALSQIGAVLCPGTLIALSGLILSGKSARTHQKVLWLLSALAGAIFSVVSGGRQTVTQLALTAIVCLAMRRKLKADLQWKKAARLIAAFSVCLLLAYSAYVGIGRNDSRFSAERYQALLIAFHSELNPEIVEGFEALPPVAKNTITEAFMYVSAPYAYFQGLYPLDWPKPTYGLYLVPFVARRVQQILPGIPTPVEKLQEWSTLFEAQGMFGSGWATTVGTLVGEFGKTGGLVVALCLGVWFGIQFVAFECRPTFGKALSLVALSIVAWFFPLFSAISDTTIFMLLCVGLALQRYETRIDRRRQSAAIRRSRRSVGMPQAGQIAAIGLIS